MLHVAAAVKGVAMAARGANSALDWLLDKKITLTLVNATRRDAVMAICIIPVIGPRDVLSFSCGWQLVQAGETFSAPWSVQRFGSDLAFYSYVEDGSETSGDCEFYVLESGGEDWAIMGAQSPNPRIMMGSGSLSVVSGRTSRVTDDFTYRLR